MFVVQRKSIYLSIMNWPLIINKRECTIELKNPSKKHILTDFSNSTEIILKKLNEAHRF